MLIGNDDQTSLTCRPLRAKQRGERQVAHNWKDFWVKDEESY